ncbi:MAG TPA: glycosyltransferase family 1 protein [Chitinophagales bacterium]|nr:glycosyltransferase family 4 protein [Chitinophagales bacterium]HMZ88832.1 glycosyltransferase family 1 protein [Chitinophagales bacterium]HNA57080.1 glycosyltransferase family 1 protein [Chitinophagales bacterium]HNE45978.1 glycosyltransferase family 1 protein [Chitinophagales bacterium]HNF68208.1 glycosyltransferase family 1 protein [Chitinophagales bacterium]
MLIAVNTRFLIKDKLEGIGWFTYETMKRLTRNHPEHHFLFLFDRDWDPEFIFSDNITPVKVWPPARHPYLWKYWFDTALPRIFKKYKPDLFISTDGMMSLAVNVPTVLVVHDLAYIEFPHHIPRLTYEYLKHFTPKYLSKADAIITVSDYSKKDIIDKYQIADSKIDVVANGASDNFKPLDEVNRSIVKQKISSGSEYFIYVGSIHPRKNVGMLMKAYDQLRAEGICDHKLVIVGRYAWKSGETYNIYKSMQFIDDVIFTGSMNQEQLTEAIGAADALVYPSLFEGFGIPVLEARYAGVPVICSNSSSLPEVGGEHAIYFDPNSAEAITTAMVQFLKNRAELKRNALESAYEARNIYNWDNSANKIYSIMQATYDNYRANRKYTANT